MTFKDKTFQIVPIPRKVVNHIFHTMQQDKMPGIVVLTKNTMQCFSCHEKDLEAMDTLPVSKIIGEIDTTHCELFAIFSLCKDEVCAAPTLQLSTNLITKKIVYCYVSLYTKGVLEISAFQFVDQKWQRCHLELINES